MSNFGSDNVTSLIWVVGCLKHCNFSFQLHFIRSREGGRIFIVYQIMNLAIVIPSKWCKRKVSKKRNEFFKSLDVRETVNLKKILNILTSNIFRRLMHHEIFCFVFHSYSGHNQPFLPSGQLKFRMPHLLGLI